jgi:hypothetical protein
MDTTETGSLTILNVGAGDIAVTFNTNDAQESTRAIEMLTDMLARGYLLAIQLPDGSYTRAKTVDRTRGRYIITVPAALVPDIVRDSEPHVIGTEAPTPENDPTGRFRNDTPAPPAGVELPPVLEEAEQHLCACGCGGRVAPGKTWVRGHHNRKRAATQTVSVPVKKSKAVGVARSAGG